MPNHRHMIFLSAACVTVAWVWLLFRIILAARWMATLPSWPVAALLVAGAAFLLLGRGAARGRGLSATIVLTAAAFALFAFPPANDLAARRAWWRESVHRIANTLRAVGDEVSDLENV